MREHRRGLLCPLHEGSVPASTYHNGCEGIGGRQGGEEAVDAFGFGVGTDPYVDAGYRVSCLGVGAGAAVGDADVDAGSRGEVGRSVQLQLDARPRYWARTPYGSRSCAFTGEATLRR